MQHENMANTIPNAMQISTVRLQSTQKGVQEWHFVLLLFPRPTTEAGFLPTHLPCPTRCIHRIMTSFACDVKTGLTFVPHGCCAGRRDLKNRRNINPSTRAVCFCIPLVQSPRGGGGPFPPALLFTAVRWGRGRALVTQNTSLSVMGSATCPKTTQGLPLSVR